MEGIDQARKNRMMLLLIAGIPLIMVLAASWLWYFVVRGDLDLVGTLGTANRGTLVQPPRQLDEVELLGSAGHVFKYADMQPKWTMLVPVLGGECAVSCERNLYITRQIHVAMGKSFSRLRRLYIADVSAEDTVMGVAMLSDDRPAPQVFTQFLSEGHRGTKSLMGASTALRGLFAEYLVDPSTWYLVDPAGWIMMSYNSDVPYKDVISDLKFLLKNSSE
jgi:hypothetical protein